MVNPTPDQRPAAGFRPASATEFLSGRFHAVPGEDPAEFDALVRDYRQKFNPDGPDERYFLQTLILCDWKRRRLVETESRFMRIFCVAKGKQILDVLTAVEGPEAAVLKLLGRQQQANERSYLRAYTELRKLQQLRKSVPAQPEPKPEPASIPAAAPPQSPQTGGIGFVSPKTDSPAIPHYDLGKGHHKPGLVFVG